MLLGRAFVLEWMRHNILFRAEYISIKSGNIAVAVTRKQWTSFRQAAYNARRNPEPILQSLQNSISILNLIYF